jgi:hypothetical protein
MSKFVLFLLFAAVNTGLMGATPSTADIPVHISPVNKWIIVDKNNWKAPTVAVSLRNEEGSLLISEKINGSKKYNLKNVSEGKYILELEDDQQIRVQSLQVASEILYSKDIYTIYKPQLKISDDHIDMNLMTQGEEAQVSIRNNEWKSEFTENTGKEVSVSKRYNLKSLPAGDYTFVVKIGGHTFTRSFTK